MADARTRRSLDRSPPRSGPSEHLPAPGRAAVLPALPGRDDGGRPGRRVGAAHGVLPAVRRAAPLPQRVRGRRPGQAASTAAPIRSASGWPTGSAGGSGSASRSTRSTRTTPVSRCGPSAASVRRDAVDRRRPAASRRTPSTTGPACRNAREPAARRRGCAVKVHLVYPSPLWRARGLSGWSVNAAGPAAVHRRRLAAGGAVGVLTGFVTGAEAHRFAALPRGAAAGRGRGSGRPALPGTARAGPGRTSPTG